MLIQGRFDPAAAFALVRSVEDPLPGSRRQRVGQAKGDELGDVRNVVVGQEPTFVPATETGFGHLRRLWRVVTPQIRDEFANAGIMRRTRARGA